MDLAREEGGTILNEPRLEPCQHDAVIVGITRTDFVWCVSTMPAPALSVHSELKGIVIILGQLSNTCVSEQPYCGRQEVGLGVALRGLDAKLSDLYRHDGGPMALQMEL